MVRPIHQAAKDAGHVCTGLEAKLTEWALRGFFFQLKEKHIFVPTYFLCSV